MSHFFFSFLRFAHLIAINLSPVNEAVCTGFVPKKSVKAHDCINDKIRYYERFTRVVDGAAP